MDNLTFYQSRENYLKEIKKITGDGLTCLEVGVLEGEFSELIFEHLKPKELHLVDPWEVGLDRNADVAKYSDHNAVNMATSGSTEDNYQTVKNKFTEQIQSGAVVLHRGYSYDVVESFEDNYFDLIYIDGCHLYECAKADLEMFLPKLKTNGLMCGHDYFPGPEGWHFGVMQAVDEFCAEYNFQMIILNDKWKTSYDWALVQKK